jgi:hydrogenase maturation protease
MMSDVVPFRIGLLGLGNLMRSDDAVGMLTVRKVTDDGRLPEAVRVIEGETLGLDLLGCLDGISHLLALDAVDTGAAPGTLVRFEGRELSHLPASKSVHLLGFSDLMNVLRLMEAAPAEVVLLGVQPESTDWGTALTPVVEAAKSTLADALLKQIEHWVEEVSDFTPLPALSYRFRGTC